MGADQIKSEWVNNQCQCYELSYWFEKTGTVIEGRFVFVCFLVLSLPVSHISMPRFQYFLSVNSSADNKREKPSIW